MKKAALVLATSVAFFFGAMSAEAGRKMVTMPSAKSVATGTGTAVKDTDRLRIPGEPGTEYIPRTPGGTAGTPIKVLPTLDYSIPRTITQTKNLLKQNLAQALLSATIAGAVAGVGWVMNEGTLSKKTKDVSTPSSTDYQWGSNQINGIPPSSTPKGLCVSLSNLNLGGGIVHGVATATPFNEITFKCHFFDSSGSEITALDLYAVRSGTGCTSPATYDKDMGACVIQGLTPVQDSDYSQLDTHINAQGADWLKSLLRDACGGSYGTVNPDGCYQSLVEKSSLSGPSTVAGPTETSLVRGPNGITTVTTSTTYNVTYGDNYFQWNKTVNTHKVNPDGTTEDTTETEDEKEEEPETPALGDPYAPEIQKYKDIATEVSNPPQVPANVNYSPWYSFGGNCSELSFTLPIYGPYTTSICPYIYDWVRPVIAFLLALWTWHRCREMWSEALRIARPI